MLWISLAIAGIAVVSGSSWNELDAKRMVNFAFASYCSEASLTKWDCHHCTEDFQVSRIVDLKENSAFVGVSVAAKEIVVSFRGTNSLSNWMSDFEVLKTKISYGEETAWVHFGFLDTYEAICLQVLEALFSARKAHPDFRTILTGHSLGATHAILFAMDLFHSYNTKDFIIYTFGSPRVGDLAFAKLFTRDLGSQHWRVTHGQDIVPHFPTTGVGYYHGSSEVFELEGKYKICQVPIEDPQCSDIYPAWEWSFSDHSTYMGISSKTC